MARRQHLLDNQNPGAVDVAYLVDPAAAAASAWRM